MSLVVVFTDQNGKYVRTIPKCTAHQYGDESIWPQHVDTLCWQCCHKFDTPPLPMPVAYDDRTDRFQVTGSFCSWNCMMAYNRDYNKSILNRGPGALAINLMYKRMTGSTSFVTPAPPRCTLKAFGGYMDIDAYRSSSASRVLSMNTVSCVSSPQVVHERKVSEGRRILSSKITGSDDATNQPTDLHRTSDDPAPKYGDTLRLRRPRKDHESNAVPLGTMLEITLGLAPHSSS